MDKHVRSSAMAYEPKPLPALNHLTTPLISLCILSSLLITSALQLGEVSQTVQFRTVLKEAEAVMELHDILYRRYRNRPGTSREKTFVVTGGNTGLGLECASDLATDQSALVVIACRDVQLGEQAAHRIRKAP